MLGITLREFAAPLGYSHNAVHHWEKGDTPLVEMVIDAIEKYHGISSKWLLDGKGEMFVTKHDKAKRQPKIAPLPRPEEAEDVARYGNTQMLVPLLSPQACAGNGAALEDYINELGGLPFSESWLRRYFSVQPKNLCLLEVVGDSMVPTIQPNELVFVDGLQHRPEYRDGIWIISMDSQLFVKRVQMTSPGYYEVTSDNKAYKPLDLDDTAQLLGRVVGGPPTRF